MASPTSNIDHAGGAGRPFHKSLGIPSREGPTIYKRSTFPDRRNCMSKAAQFGVEGGKTLHANPVGLTRANYVSRVGNLQPFEVGRF